MLEGFTHFYIRVFLVIALHTGATKLRNLLSTQVELYWAHSANYILPHKVCFVGKCNRYYKVPKRLLERASKLLYLNNSNVILMCL